MNTPDVVTQAITRRTLAGLVLTFDIPDRTTPFVCYPRDEAEKARWLANAQAKGWRVRP